jgi:hypothetical protein
LSLAVEYGGSAEEFTFTPTVLLAYGAVFGTASSSGGITPTYSLFYESSYGPVDLRASSYSSTNSVTDTVLGCFFDGSDNLKMLKVRWEDEHIGTGTGVGDPPGPFPPGSNPPTAGSFSGSTESSGTFSYSVTLGDTEVYSLSGSFSKSQTISKEWELSPFMGGYVNGTTTTTVTWDVLDQQFMYEVTNESSGLDANGGVIATAFAGSPSPLLRGNPFGAAFNVSIFAQDGAQDTYVTKELYLFILRPSNKLFLITPVIYSATFVDAVFVEDTTEFLSSVAIHPAGTTQISETFSMLPLHGSYDPYTQEVAIGTEPMCFV